MDQELSAYSKPVTSHALSGLAGSQWMLLHVHICAAASVTQMSMNMSTDYLSHLQLSAKPAKSSRLVGWLKVKRLKVDIYIPPLT